MGKKLLAATLALSALLVAATWTLTRFKSFSSTTEKAKGAWETCEGSYPGVVLPGCLNRTELRRQCKSCHRWFGDRYFQEAAAFTIQSIDDIARQQEDFSDYLPSLRKALQIGAATKTELQGTQAANYLIDRKHGILVGWTQRAGCSGVVYSFFDHMHLVNHAMFMAKAAKGNGVWVHDYRNHGFRAEYGQVKLSELLDRNPHQPLLRLKFVRDPYRRALSSYTHTQHIGKLMPGGFAGFKRKFPAPVLRNVSTVFNMSFRQWIQTMSWIQEKSHGTYAGLNHHYAPQATPMEAALANLGKPMFDAIFQIDNFNFSLMPDVLGLNYTYPSERIHQTNRTSADPGTWSELPLHLAKKQMPKNYLDIYKPPHGHALEALVFKVYCLDFALGGYQRLRL